MKPFRNGMFGIWLLASACTGSVGADSGEKDDLVGSVETSLKTWQTLKAEGGMSYRYIRTQQPWTGSGFTLTVGVVEDVPATRSYEAYTRNDGSRQVTETWEESGSELGSHALTGYDAVPIEALYERCLDQVLARDGTTNDFTVTFHEDGLLEACYSRPVSCADDCSDGVGIDTLTFEG
jgi:hypothetical protein